ncbi:MAG: 50S ribosomal protein L2 [Candidatus Thorarchaeota archaeon]
MGKKILVQRRGRGTKIFRAPINRIAPARYPLMNKSDENLKTIFKVVDLVHEPGRGVPLVKLTQENENKITYLPATEGISVGDKIEMGENVPITPGNILPLQNIPESAIISNIEIRAGDGGAICRSSGGYATILSKTSTYAAVKLPSGTIKQFRLACRATIGVVAAGGRTEKPFLKAGKKFALKKARGKLGSYPKVRGVAMNHHVHPFGGGSHRSPHQPTTISRHAPPGAKVGLIAAGRTGQRRGKREKIETL